MNDNTITVTGNVCADLVSRATTSGVEVTSLRLASTPRRFRNGAWEDGETTFFTVNCWRGLARNVFASVHRGDPVVVQGVLRVRKWERNGTSGTSVEIDAVTVGHDLGRGVTTFERVRQSAPASPSLPGTGVPGAESGRESVSHSTDVDAWSQPLAAAVVAA